MPALVSFMPRAGVGNRKPVKDFITSEISLLALSRLEIERRLRLFTICS